jgi:HSP20 family protein
MSLVRYNPMRDLLSVEREFSRLFSDLESRFNFPSRKEVDEEYENAVWMPLTDIYEDKENYRLILDLPGLAKSDVKLSYLNGELKISGERQQQKEEKDGKFHRVERTYGKFFRSFRLPERVKEDKIEAEFKDGQLTVIIPKAEEVKPKELQISVK